MYVPFCGSFIIIPVCHTSRDLQHMRCIFSDMYWYLFLATHSTIILGHLYLNGVIIN